MSKRATGKETRECDAAQTDQRNSCSATEDILASAVELAEKGNLDEAERAATSILAFEPSNSEALNVLGFVSFSRGDVDAAVTHFEKAYSADRTNLDTGKNLAEIYAQIGRVEEARKLCFELMRARETKRVLLVNPHDTAQEGFSNPPLGLLYIAGTLEKHGFEVRVVDACLDGKSAVKTALREFAPDMVGITCLTPGRKKALELAAMAKESDPTVKVVMGGVHPTIMHRQMMENYPYVDYLVLGEGEMTCLELAQGMDPAKIDGLVYRENGEIKKTANRKYVENLDDIPFPAWHLVDLKRYPARDSGVINGVDLSSEPRVSVVFSRGCTGHCSFCSTWWIWHGWRHRSAKNMADELEVLNKQHGVRHICFADDAMTVDRQATIELCDEIIARKLDIVFWATTRSDCVDQEMLHKLKAAGCYAVSYGIETGSPTLLEAMNKENDLEHSERAIQMTKNAGISAVALMMIGNQGETRETVAESAAFLRKTQPDRVSSLGAVWVLPGTKLYQDSKRRGLIDDDFWLSDEPYWVYTAEHSVQELEQLRQLLLDLTYRPEALDTIQPACGQAEPDAARMAATYDSMYEQRKATMPEALTMDYWKDHFATQTVCGIPELKGRLLDVGCGTGEIDILLARHNPDIVVDAVDISAVALDIAEKYIAGEDDDVRRRVRFRKSPIETMQFEDNTFDACFTSHTLEHIADHDAAFAEISRVLKPGSPVVVVMPRGHNFADETDRWHLEPQELEEHLRAFGDDVKVWTSPDGKQLAATMRTPAKPRVICMMRIKNEEAFLAQTLKMAAQIADGFVILDDGSTDGTPEICKSHPKVLRYEHQTEATIDEARDKDKLLQMALDENPDWILALDGDEVFEDVAPAALREEIRNAPSTVAICAIKFLYMWNSHDKVRVDGQYRIPAHPRLFRASGLPFDARELRFRTTQHGANFHCGSLPANLPGDVHLLDIYIKHYGYFEAEQRQSKRAFYERQDPQAAARGFYDHLTSEAGMELLDWRERELSEVNLSFRGRRSLSGAALPGQSLQSKLDCLPAYYRFARPEILAMVPNDARSILDIGCAAGILGHTLKSRQSCKVTGIEFDGQAAEVAAALLDQVYAGDAVEVAPSLPDGGFDCIVASDVLEHLANPEALLRALRAKLTANGKLVISIPNVRHWSVLRGLIEGRWDYEDAGLLDRTHLRFFTLSSFQRTLAACGFEASAISGTSIPGETIPDALVQALREQGLDTSSLVQESQAYQFLVEARPKAQATRAGLTSVVVLSCNQADYTRACVDSIRRCTDGNYEIIVVDNGSTDATRAYLEEISREMTNLKLVYSDTNLGYAGGNNLGLAAASGDYVVLLNNDVVVTTGWLDRLVACAESDPNLGIVGPMSNSTSGPQLVQAPGYDTNTLAGLEEYAAKSAETNFGRTIQTWRVVGFCMLIKRSVITKIGGLDPIYGKGNFEDDDFCLRALLAGFRSTIARDSFVHHFGSRTFAGEKIDYSEQLLTNWEIFKDKWGLPADLQYGSTFDLSETVRKGFDQSRHYCPLPSQRTQTASATRTAPDGPILEVVDRACEAVESDPSDAVAIETLRAAQAALKKLSQSRASNARRKSKKPAKVSGPTQAEIDSRFRRINAALGMVGSTTPAPERRANAGKPTISLCMIARDEEEFIVDALESVKGLVDETIVVDTGSKDKTRELAAAHGACVFDCAWTNSFADARNESIRRAKGDWVLILDADERIDADSKSIIRQAVEKAACDAYELVIHSFLSDDANPSVEVSINCRLFRNRPDYRFTGRVHETNLASVVEAGGRVQPLNALIVHHGYKPALQQRRNKFENYIAMSKLELAESPNDLYALHHLAATYVGKKDFAGAIPYLVKAAEIVPPTHPYAAMICARLIESLLACHRADEAKIVADRAAELGVRHPQLSYARGNLLRALGRDKEAVEAFSDAKEIGKSGIWDGDTSVYGYKAEMGLAAAYLATGDKASAASHARSALAAYPGSKTALDLLAQAEARSTKKQAATKRAARGKGTLTLCMIARNEEQFLPQCLESVKDVVDEVVLVDTGSEDRTVEIAKSFGANVFTYAWNDNYSDARNEALKHATCDWVLFLDADERVDSASKGLLSQAVREPDADGYDLLFHNYCRPGATTPDIIHRVCRLHRNKPEYRFVGRIHENVVPSIIENNGTINELDVLIHHYGYQPEIRKSRNKHERYVKMLKQELEEKPGNMYVLHHLSAAHCAEQEFEEAIPYLEMEVSVATSEFEYSGQAYARLANAYWATNRPDLALAAIEKAAAKGIHHPEITFTKANACLSEERYEEAIRLYEEAIALGKSRKWHGDPATFGYKAEFGIARAQAALGNFAEAVERCEQILKEHPDHAHVHEIAAMACTELRQLDKAETHWLRVLDLVDDRDEARMHLAALLEHQGRFADAAEHYLKIVEAGRETAETRFRLGVCYEQTEDMARAEENLLRAIELRPDLVLGHSELGRVYAAEGKVEEALDCFVRAIEIDRRYANAYFSAGDLLYSIGRYAEAAEVYENGLRCDPRRAEAFFTLGNCCFQLGAYDAAVTAYEQALAINPEYNDARSNLSLAEEILSSVEAA